MDARRRTNLSGVSPGLVHRQKLSYGHVLVEIEILRFFSQTHGKLLGRVRSFYSFSVPPFMPALCSARTLGFGRRAGSLGKSNLLRCSFP